GAEIEFPAQLPDSEHESIQQVAAQHLPGHRLGAEMKLMLDLEIPQLQSHPVCMGGGACAQESGEGARGPGENVSTGSANMHSVPRRGSELPSSVPAPGLPDSPFRAPSGGRPPR